MSLFANKICLTNYCKHVSYSGAGYLNKPFRFSRCKIFKTVTRKRSRIRCYWRKCFPQLLISSYILYRTSECSARAKVSCLFQIALFRARGERNPFRKLGYVTGRRIYTTRFTYPLTPLPTRKNGKLCRSEVLNFPRWIVVAVAFITQPTNSTTFYKSYVVSYKIKMLGNTNNNSSFVSTYLRVNFKIIFQAIIWQKQIFSFEMFC